MLATPDLQRLAAACGAGLLLALLSALTEGWVARRAAGLRRRRGLPLTGVLADTLKLLARPPLAAGPWRPLAIAASLLPVLLLVGALPAAGGLGLAAGPEETPGGRLAVLFGLSLLALAALTLPGAAVPAPRRAPLSGVTVALLGVGVSLGLCAAAVQTAGVPAEAFAQRGWTAWAMLRHPLGLAAFVGAMAIGSIALRRALGVPLLPGEIAPPGLVWGPGAGSAWLLWSRHLWTGALAALAAHVYLGAGSLSADAALWLACLILLVIVALVRHAVSDDDPEGLARLAWTRLVPLAALDAALAAARHAGWLPWS